MQFIKNTLILLLFGVSLNTYAWHDPIGPGGASAAMGGCGVASKGFWGITQNQAALAFQKNLSIGAYYENQFLLKELSYNHVTAAIPLGGGALGINVGYYGYSEYNEQTFGLAYGRQLGDRFAMGVQLDYLRTFVGGDYGSKGLLTFDIGFMYQMNENLNIGAHVFNPMQVELADYNEERVPAILSLGAEWKLNKQLRLLGEFQSNGNENLQAKAGAEYLINDWFAIRGGLSSDPSLFTFGVGFHLDQLHIDISSGMHQVLGYSPQFSMHYTFGEE